jgi:SAM-dependent methyltransferase
VHPFDARYGTDTSGLIGGGSLGAGHANDAFVTAYWGIAPSRLASALERWKGTLDRPVQAYAFADLGCGKGRALLLASEWPFREAMGVELNPALAETAERNVALWQRAGRARCPVRVVQGDAVEAQLPAGPCLVFLYNPFGAPVMRKLVEALRKRVASGGGLVDVIYQNAEAEEDFRRCPDFRLLWRESLPMSEDDRAADAVSSAEDVTCAWRLE